MTENPELFYETQAGYFYTAALADVKGYSETGWFDLKVTLTDEVGNSQEQILSPAFR